MPITVSFFTEWIRERVSECALCIGFVSIESKDTDDSRTNNKHNDELCYGKMKQKMLTIIWIKHSSYEQLSIFNIKLNWHEIDRIAGRWNWFALVLFKSTSKLYGVNCGLFVNLNVNLCDWADFWPVLVYLFTVEARIWCKGDSMENGIDREERPITVLWNKIKNFAIRTPVFFFSTGAVYCVFIEFPVT